MPRHDHHFISRRTNIYKIGSRAEVWHGSATHTPGGLKMADLFQDRYGRIRSKKASDAARRNNNLGHFLREKGVPGFVKVPKKGPSKSGSRRKFRIPMAPVAPPQPLVQPRYNLRKRTHASYAA